jgi:alpha-1,3-mannosyltransferase
MFTKPLSILGIDIIPATMEKAVSLLDDRFEARKQSIIIYLNAHTAVQALKNSAFRSVLTSSLVLNDGAGVNIACKMKYGHGFPTNLNGTDFTPHYLEKTRHAFRIFLLGARPEVIEETAKILQQRFPRHTIAGYHDGFFRPEENTAIVNAIRTAKADLILAAMGNPRQEMWLAENLEKTGAVLGIGVGALFDFMTGRFPRAPKWVRMLRAEWMFRLLCEPRRLWKRYTVGNIVFLTHAALDTLKYRLGGHKQN